MYTIKNSHFSGAICALVIIALIVVGCGRFGGTKDGGIGNEVKNFTIPTIDPKEPFPALSTDAVDALAADLPELAKYRETILAAERDAIKGAVDDIRSKSKAVNNPRTAVEIPPVIEERNGAQAVAMFSGPFNLIPVAMAAEPDLSNLKSTQQFLIGHQIGLFMVDSGKADQANGTGSKTITMKNEKTGEVQATWTVSIDTAGGTYSTEITTKVSMPVFGLDAGSKVSLKGNPCPDASGKVELMVKSASNARAGRAGSVFHDRNIEATIAATVGDDANLASTNFDLKQATHSSGSGQQVDFITSLSGNLTGEKYSTINLDVAKIDRGSQVVSPADQQASDVGLVNALYLAIGVLESARERWQNGGCVKIEANSPGAVEPSSTTAIPVKVRHKWDGSEVPSKLEAVLKGETSVIPTSLAKTPGTLTYTAPGDKGKQATISLTANSRRGRAKLDLDANTGGASYQIVGGLDDWHTDTAVCDIMKPFRLSSYILVVSFSGGMSGTYEYSGGPFNARGNGTYTISLPDGLGKPGTMTGSSGPGEVTGDKVYKGSGTEKYTLTPIEPCS